MRRMRGFIYFSEEWPVFKWDAEQLLDLLGEVRNLQGRLTGKMEGLGFNLRAEALLETLTEEVLKTSEIEGEVLDANQVRSSIARKLGMEISGLIESDRDVDGIVDMLLDATHNYKDEVTEDRLFGWHSALFSSGRSGMNKIQVGQWREDTTGPMQVVSGAMGKERIHFQAPDSKVIPKEMKLFLKWFNTKQILDPILKAGIAHLWFVTIHPFEDGNGRMTRAITDLVLTSAEKNPQRFYSMSAQIRAQRKGYYAALEETQKGNIDITKWLVWFLNCLKNAIISSNDIVSKVLSKHLFWKEHEQQVFNQRQITMLNKLFDGFTGKLTSTKWGKIMKCSHDTALRDIRNLLDRNILMKEPGGGRNTSYSIIRV